MKCFPLFSIFLKSNHCGNIPRLLLLLLLVLPRAFYCCCCCYKFYYAHTHTHTRCQAPPQSSDLVGLRISISSKFPNDAHVAGKELLYGNHCTGCTNFLSRTSSWEKCNKKFTILQNEIPQNLKMLDLERPLRSPHVSEGKQRTREVT